MRFVFSFHMFKTDQHTGFSLSDVRIERSRQSRYIRLKVHPEKGVVLTVPGNCPESRAMEFLHSKKDWLERTLARTENLKNRTSQFIPGNSFSTKFHVLELTTHQKNTLRLEVAHGRLTVFYPTSVDVLHEKVQAFIRNAIIRTMRFEAARYLPLRTQELAKLHKLQVGKISVRNNKTRWGSCTVRNDISLNIHLMRLPDELIDYVIMHELAHIRVKRHGTPFWEYLETLLPGAKLLDKKLNKYHISYW